MEWGFHARISSVQDVNKLHSNEQVLDISFYKSEPQIFFPADGLKTVKLGLNKMECGFLARLRSVQDVSKLHPNEQVLDLSFYESIL